MQQKIRGTKWLGTVRADAARIGRAYKKAMRLPQKTAAQEWLCDNAYLLLGAAKQACAAIRALPPLPKGENAPTALEEVCAQLYAHMPEWTTQQLAASLRDKTLCGAEAEALDAMLRVVILRHAAKGSDDAQALSKAVRTLRALADVDLEAVRRVVSPLERTLSQDPAGAYAQMDDASRAAYRTWLLRAASRRKTDADALAQIVLEKARRGKTARMRHVGAYILPPYPRRRGTAFLMLELLVPLALSVAAGLWQDSRALPLLLFLPLWELTSGFLTACSVRGVPSVRLPRMEMTDVPQQMQTLLTVSALVPSAADAPKLRDRLEQLYLSNGRQYIKVCLLADLKQSGTPEKPEDAADVAAVQRVIDALNAQYGGGFIFAVRPRVYAPTEGYFSGWERKRGAIIQLVRAIRGVGGDALRLTGDTQGIGQTRYLLLLDADTRLPMDAAMQLLSVAAHPLQQPEVDGKRGAVTAGYGVLAPRVCTDAASCKTLFQRLLRADSGLTMYDDVVSERYQDLFGEGIFAGKGLVDVQAFHAVLDHSLPTGRVLSHDSVEGGYLRCGYVSDVQVSDDFPKDQRVYFARMSRWVRGDWQNLRFIFGKNPLSGLSRWKLADNLRRSLTPVVCLFTLLYCVFLPQKTAVWLCAVCISASSGGNLAAAIRSLVRKGPFAVSRLSYSGTAPVSLGYLLRGLIQICQLPLAGFTNAAAIAQALYRSFFSRKRLLEWTTFAQSDANGSARGTLSQCLWIGAVSAALFVAPWALLRLVSIVFLLDVPFLLLSGRLRSYPRNGVSFADREKLTSCAAAMWRYFEENCDFRNNYLPPDNVQETPVYRVAQRTSPTNIGLALLCALTARDLGFLDSDALCTFLRRSLDSVEQLETYRGNLLNWYDTRTLRPLEPRYVSSVDCGNFLCCLKALQQGVREYAPQQPKLRQIDERIGRILEKADLSVLYNPQRRLFYIGVDPDTEKPADAYYDLLMSEARMTGYYAVAKRLAPKKHWAALSRTMGKVGRYTGLLSWSGTMFEYFMPYLFLPAPEGTLGYEALKFCSWCQRRASRGARPFGVSESGFYAFDRDFNYQYKAHGVHSLALRRSPEDGETVVAPYASFLLMQLEPQTALRNLRRLEKMQMTGRWGFYEAADFTRAHVGGREYAVVRSYMAHHVGMSLLAVNNVLHDGILRRRFLRDSEMRTAESLLEEGAPTDVMLFRTKARRAAPTPRERLEQQKREIVDASPLRPNARVWSNGEMSLCAADVGASQCVYRGVSLFVHGTDLLRRPTGPVVVLQGGGTALPFAPMMQPSPPARYRCTFTGTQAQYTVGDDNVQLRVQIRVHPTLSALLYTFTVRSRRPWEGSLLFYAEPSLTPHREAAAHPAFSKLFLEDRWDAENRAVLFRKRERDGGRGVCLAAGFAQQTSFTCTRSKSTALHTAYGVASLLGGDVQFPDAPGNGDGCLGFQVPLRLSAYASEEMTLILAAASTENEALEKLLGVRRSVPHKGAPTLFADGKMEAVLADKLLPGAVFGVRDDRCAQISDQNGHPRHRLWQFGISGERPMLYRQIGDAQDVSSASPFIRAVHRLNLAGFACDLLLGYSEGGEYDSPVLHALQRAIREACGREDGASWIVPVNLRRCSEADQAFLQALSVFLWPIRGEETKPVPIRALRDASATDSSEKLFSFTDRSVRIPKDRKRPYVPWSLVLSNASFGTMVSDKALGFTWAINAHENKLTPWTNDTAADNRGELLILCVDGEYYDLLRAASAEFSPDRAVWRGKAAGVAYSAEVTVPGKALCKRCRVKLHSGQARSVQLFYYLEPVLGSRTEDGAFVRVRRHGDGLVLSSPAAAVHGFAALTVQGGADMTVSDRAAFWTQSGQSGGAGVCAAVGKTFRLTADETQTVCFDLSFAAAEQAALTMPRLPHTDRQPENSLTVQSAQPAFDRMVNTWLPWQIRKCRIEGRTGFYQCGGAWGFRDQIQDVSAFLWLDPPLVRRQLLRAAAVQFSQGDVLHWWHRLPPADGGLRGVRTRYRDDLLWLPWLTAEYVRSTGDASVLDVRIPYLHAPPLGAQETERYFSPERGSETGSLLEHGVRALDCAYETGAHGLVLIGGGDWNDGFDRVGISGKGESVWLTQFMIVVLRAFAPLCDAPTAKRFSERAQSLVQAVEGCWDTDHYLRAFMDDGTPLGKSGDAECSIDSVSQSFAAFAGLRLDRVRTALRTASRKLTDPQRGIVKLLDPPFTGSGKQAGYITAYPPGIRENGGQYTHAAVWLCRAMLQNGMTEEGNALFRMLNPAQFCLDAARCTRYGGEVFALAGDIPSVERPIFCTGWSLYTGSAAWMYRTAVETILGICVEKDTVRVRPRPSSDMLPISLKIQVKSTQIRLRIESVGDGELYENNKKIERIPLDGQAHTVSFR
ncbi:MAG: hypothetical protein IJT44_10305 [Clostridia bacterium]|nr:hypothetical protein [Clostridia bacterium]